MKAYRWCWQLWLLLIVLGNGGGWIALGDAQPADVISSNRPSTGVSQRVASSLRAAASLVSQYGMATTRQQLGPMLRFQPADHIEVYLYTTTLTPETLDVLRAHGVQPSRSHSASGIVYASLPLTALDLVAELPFVRWIGQPSYGHVRVGSVTTEGDRATRAANLRRQLEVDGSGVRIGMISDSLVHTQASIESGDLPPNIIIVNGRNGAASDATDEGVALAEIIYDLAPGATLLFHSGFPTTLDMIDAIDALTDAGADIIVDDLGFFFEPFFEDGRIARAVQRAIDRGVVYVTSAGNSADAHYQGPYVEHDPDDGEPRTNLHDFGDGATQLHVRLPAGESVTVILQWPDPFDGSANTADYDLLLLDNNGNTLATSQDRQLASAAPPMEAVTFRNTTSSSVVLGVAINRREGEALALEMYFVGPVRVLDHNVPGSSTFGHPCVREALAVGALPLGSPDPETFVEPFSSQGPCDIFLPTLDVRSKPDVVSVDGVSTSLRDFTPFFGTSASAPHVAAVAALLIEVAGGPGAVSNRTIANAIRLGASLPLENLNASGMNPRVGFGEVNAVQSAALLQGLAQGNEAPRAIIEFPPEEFNVAPGTTVAFRGNCIDLEDDRPFTFSWDFAGVLPASTVQNPPEQVLTEPGSFLATLTCMDAAGNIGTTQRLVNVNRPPDGRITQPAEAITIEAGSRLDFAGTCEDPDGPAPLAFRWDFGGGASIAFSVDQNPTDILFNVPGTFVVTLTCQDDHQVSDPNPASRLVIVIAANQNNAAQNGGGGGGCSLAPAGAGDGPLAFLGNLGLPLLALALLQVWRRWRQPEQSSSPFKEKRHG